MKSNVNTQALIRQIAARVPCAVCGHHFGMSDIHVLGQRENVWAMRVNCRECRTQALVLVQVNSGTAHPIQTDLAPSEWNRFKDKPPISVDDVIQAHQYIQSYTGDFSEIMDEPLPEE